jgi:hypothetical protein
VCDKLPKDIRYKIRDIAMPTAERTIMSYNVQLLTDEPILLETIHEDFNASTELAGLMEVGMQSLDAAGQPVVYIMDHRLLAMGLNDLIVAANQVAKQRNFLNHPNIKKIIMVSTNRLLATAAKGMNSLAFGFIKIETCETLEQAFILARAENSANSATGKSG